MSLEHMKMGRFVFSDDRHPFLKVAFALTLLISTLQAQESEDTTTASGVEARAAFEKRDHNICWNFPTPEEKPIREDIAYLRGIPDDVSNGAQACNNECRQFSYGGSLTGWVTAGQRFHDPGLFNVILRSSNS